MGQKLIAKGAGGDFTSGKRKLAFLRSEPFGSCQYLHLFGVRHPCIPVSMPEWAGDVAFCPVATPAEGCDKVSAGSGSAMRDAQRFSGEQGQEHGPA